ncbi:MAG: hypothetical protein C4K58_04140 [Flavobacteriaceae bacterium]|nr:MAG: hypothetical protein C4K58_04140 [Flavobacteriaceae bacterium]
MIIFAFAISISRILIKLIQRETEMTAYDMLKKLKGGFIAFGWQAQAGLFEQNLKDTFQPDNRKEDLFIQVILQNAFRSGRLIPIQIMLMDEAAAGY